MTDSAEVISVRYGRTFIDGLGEPVGEVERQTDSLIWLLQTRRDIATLIDRADRLTDSPDDVDAAEAAVRVTATAQKAATEAGWDLAAVTPRRHRTDPPAETASEHLADLPAGLLGQAARPALSHCAALESAQLESINDLMPTARIAEAVVRRSQDVALAAWHQAHLLADRLATAPADTELARHAHIGESLLTACRQLHETLGGIIERETAGIEAA